jgi:hypothetical protein
MNFPLIADTKSRIIRARWWLLAQLLLTAVFLALGVLFLRMPDKYIWQVVLSLTLAAVLVTLFVLMQSKTLRSLMGDERKVKLIYAAMTFAGWVLLAWVALKLAFRLDDKIELYSSYLNSRLPAGMRARIFTEEHIESVFTKVQWLIVYVVIPGIFIPLAALTSITGAGLPKRSELSYLAKKRWWIPILVAVILCAYFFKSIILQLLLLAAIGLLPLAWKRIRSVWFNWRWMPVVLVVAFILEHLLPKFFAADPAGTTRHQLWAVLLKTAAVYLISVILWLILLIWSTVLLNGGTEKCELT